MSNHLTLARQTKILESWQEEIDTLAARLSAAKDNAIRAVGHRQAYVAISSQEEITATSQAMAQTILQQEPTSLAALATICKVVAAATGQTNQQLVDKLVAAINA